MTSERIHSTEYALTEEGAVAGSRLVPKGTSFIVVRGMSLAKEFRVSMAMRDMAFNQDVKAVIPCDEFDRTFIYYYLKSQSNPIRDSASEAAHGTKKLDMAVLEQWPIPKVPLDIQKKIAALLCHYDDLIENNKRRIILLENMAEEIYREWFVRFRFPGWQEAEFEKGYPASWRVLKFDEFCKLKRGYDLPDSKVMDGPYPVLASTSVKTFHSEYKVKAPVITTGRSGSLGTVLFKRENCWPLNTTLYVQNFKGNSPFFIYFTLKSMPLETFNSGAGVPSLNRNHLAGLRVVVPDRTAQKAFDDIVEPIFRQVDTLQEQSEKLQKAKNQLLPRLISGKLSVENLDIQFPPSMQSDSLDNADEAAA
jgi:type I restriction enzyme S subunit